MPRKRLTIPAKRYRVDEITVHRKGYRRADGTYVKPSVYVRPSQVIERAAYKKEDVGAVGRGIKVIPIEKGGMRSPAGEYKISASATQRRKVLKSLIRKGVKSGKTRDEAELSVYRRLSALKTLFKRTHRNYAKIINTDMIYFKKNLTGEDGKMAYPKAAVAKWRSMSHKARVKARR